MIRSLYTAPRLTYGACDHPGTPVLLSHSKQTAGATGDSAAKSLCASSWASARYPRASLYNSWGDRRRLSRGRPNACFSTRYANPQRERAQPVSLVVDARRPECGRSANVPRPAGSCLTAQRGRSRSIRPRRQQHRRSHARSKPTGWQQCEIWHIDTNVIKHLIAYRYRYQ